MYAHLLYRYTYICFAGLLGDGAYVREQCTEVRFFGEGAVPEMSVVRVWKDDSHIFVLMFSQPDQILSLICLAQQWAI